MWPMDGQQVSRAKERHKAHPTAHGVFLARRIRIFLLVSEGNFPITKVPGEWLPDKAPEQRFRTSAPAPTGLTGSRGVWMRLTFTPASSVC
jgi:hypothetical protein